MFDLLHVGTSCGFGAGTRSPRFFRMNGIELADSARELAAPARLEPPTLARLTGGAE